MTPEPRRSEIAEDVGMTPQGTAYLVTSGHYSSLVPQAVFSTLTAAQEWVEERRELLDDDPTGYPTVYALPFDLDRSTSPVLDSPWVCWELVPPYRDDPGGWRNPPVWMAPQ